MASAVVSTQYDVVEAGARIITRYMDLDYENYDFENCESSLFRALPPIEIDVYAALMKARGNLTNAARLLGRPRRVLTDFMTTLPELYQVLDEIRHQRLDAIEERVLDAAEAGSPSEAKFILTTLGKDRGYTTRIENTGKDGAPLDRVVRDRISDDQLLRIAQEVQANMRTIEGEYDVVS